MKSINYRFKSELFYPVLIFSLIVFSRLIVLDGHLWGYGWDPGSFALSADSYSLQDTRPHLPGYYLHSSMIRLVSLITGDHLTSMICLSAIYSALAGVILYFILIAWLDKSFSLLLTFFVFSNPFVWFYGSVAEVYSFDIFFACLLIFLGLSNRLILFTPVLMAIAAGIRPSSPVLLLPLYIYLWYYQIQTHGTSQKMMVGSHLIGVIILFLWLIPMLNSAGGIIAYLKLYETHNPVEDISFLQNIYRLSSYMIFLIAPFVIYALFQLFTKGGISSADRLFESGDKQSLIILVYWWLIPPMLFFFLIHYSKGYFMLCVPAFLIFPVLYWYKPNYLKIQIAIIILLQSLFFLFMPYHSPDPQIYFTPERRQINIFETWVERTTSDYLLTRSKIEAMQECFLAIQHGIEAQRMYHPLKKYVFIDPLCIVSPRVMQAQFKGVAFTKFLRQYPFQFGYFKGLTQEARANFSGMLLEAVIISRTDFTRKYIKDLRLDKLDQNNWTIMTVDSSDAETLARIYAGYFSRR